MPHKGGKKNCSAANKICYKCKTIGHYGRVCEKSEAASAEANVSDVSEVNLQSSLQPLPSDSSVSFSFGVEALDDQDFRVSRKEKEKE